MLAARKTDSARARASFAINPTIIVETYTTPTVHGNAVELIRNYDIIVDGSDNLPTRYLPATCALGKGSQTSTARSINSKDSSPLFALTYGPCYRCSFPGATHRRRLFKLRRSWCVLGVVPGLIGDYSGFGSDCQSSVPGDNLALHVDAIQSCGFREFNIRRDPNCPVCGESPVITEPIDSRAILHHQAVRKFQVPPLRNRKKCHRVAKRS